MAEILIVDDSSFSRRVLRAILEDAGHHVQEAADGLSALERIGTQHTDLLMLDLTMEGMNGIEVLTQARQMRPELPIIVATADIQQATQHLVSEAGASGFIPKPFMRDDVVGRVQRALNGAGI